MKFEEKQISRRLEWFFVHISNNKKNWLVAGLVFIWFITTIAGFWWFQFRSIQVFDSQAEKNNTVFFESGELGERLERLVSHHRLTGSKKETISVVHFWNPDCSCNRFNENHVKKIIAEYAAKNVQFTIVVSGRDNDERKKRSVLAKQVFNHAAVFDIRSDWPPDKGPASSPAAGILNQKGELVYFGPYSLGARCAPDKGKFVEAVLDRLNDQKRLQKKQLNTLAVGCFCPWR